MAKTQEIIHLNVGGKRFSTSRETLTWFPDSFFSGLLSGRISTYTDDSGAIFIDRDPDLFSKILNFLRTKEINLRDTDLHALRHEAEFYCISPLVKRLDVCEELHASSCGDALFQGILPPPCVYPTLPAPPTSTCPTRGTGLVPPQSTLAQDPRRVNMLQGHFNWICAAYPRFVALYRLKESLGWILTWTSPEMTQGTVEHIALNAKAPGPGASTVEQRNRMVAASCINHVKLWCVSSDGSNSSEVGSFNLGAAAVDTLFFIGSQFVTLSFTGKVGVWNAVTQNWQIQDVQPISSFDTAGTSLLLGGHNGAINLIDMQKFPLRMKDNDLLVTEVYRDPAGDSITALSVYLTPKATALSLNRNWLEIAYGTSSGNVRIIVQHPETVGQGPQLFQTFTVHTHPVRIVLLSEKHLISVCCDYNHVRSWSVTRFRGMINTQPGSVSLASYKVMTFDDGFNSRSLSQGNQIGPYGDKDDIQVFIQKVIPDTRQVFVRLASTGQRICSITSVDGSSITSFCVHDCEGSSRMGSRSRRFLFTGHSNGSIQMWDLSTALEQLDCQSSPLTPHCSGGPTPSELMRLLEHCDLSSATPTVSPAVSMYTMTTEHTDNTARL